jgi:hypothetical protein
LCAVGNVDAADTTQRGGVEVGVGIDGGSDFDAAALFLAFVLEVSRGP